ncbi:bifunctional DNA-formamidopyrimidine glycosylase/DNA-(apurinic or apyrimidinic site) lyase [Paenibacillus thalictri]|uniref:Bifunctional DNA-formamidopyrimidine glycosylase/DNA-(Apurinic or apyrimidinic site) lyase n=1 Tax=Paenibacillus thalictri TaxID=2527873 RepID=A0A4Q9DV48_9BACL|nr:bifunctional DNA-formamidopyrimidine glycosylase/DNA-(apurinic or apyrimidinic site) lyase [Paenibacillus thalictri]TBL80235.1 bifunctional DNA-formamidopyrimidine glycosylase/DNA-(apurinic or apyrimidinic site) lyase [Paenibacillus thalictri]
MPELPEMETYKRLLSPRVVGKLITAVQVEREKSLNVPAALFEREVTGQAIVRIERRAKHLLFHLSSSKVLLLHLMLGGSMFYGTSEQKPNRTAQVTLQFGANHLYFIGLRLGYLHLHDPAEAEQLLRKLGPEPLEPDFTLRAFAETLEPRRGNLKVTLVDQAVFSGIGNCYSDEICFEAGLLPSRLVGSLSGDELERLYHAMHKVLQEAIRYGGYMDMPLYAGDELTGSFDSRCLVYDREGEPCARCGQPLERRELSSKKCFYCTNCQH